MCPAGTEFLDGICVRDSKYAGFHGAADYLQAESTPADWVAVFPADNFFGDLARRRVAGGVLQNYVAAGEVLAKRQLDGLEKDRPALAVYSTDQRSGTISGIPNLTRSPQVWLYLQSHYSASAEIQPGLFILRRDEARRQTWSPQFSPLAFHPAPPARADDGQKVFEIADQVAWPVNADLLRIRLLLRYPLWWNFGKPWSVSVVIGRADGTTKRVRAIVAPNRDSDIWVYPGDDAQLGDYFSPDSRSWRAGAGSPVRSIELKATTMGWFSVQPSALRIEKVEAVSLGSGGQPHQP